MAYALLNTSEEKDYHKAVLSFLEEIEHDDVRGVVMVAITEAGPYLSWDCNNLDFAAAANVVQAQSVLNYMGGMDDEDSCGPE